MRVVLCPRHIGRDRLPVRVFRDEKGIPKYRFEDGIYIKIAFVNISYPSSILSGTSYIPFRSPFGEEKEASAAFLILSWISFKFPAHFVAEKQSILLRCRWLVNRSPQEPVGHFTIVAMFRVILEAPRAHTNIAIRRSAVAVVIHRYRCLSILARGI